jgi:hypothetical protein
MKDDAWCSDSQIAFKTGPPTNKTVSATPLQKNAQMTQSCRERMDQLQAKDPEACSSMPVTRR